MLKNLSTPDDQRQSRKLKSRHSLGNARLLGGWLMYHYCGFKYRIKTRNGFSYTVPTTVHRWLNVSNNVITAPPHGGAAWVRT